MASTTRLLLAASALLILGCKSKKEPPAVDPVPVGSAMVSADAMAAGSAGMATGSGSAGSGAATTFPLAAGETYYGGKVMVTNLVDWKVADGTVVQLGIITTGNTAEGREEGVLRAYHVGSDAHDVGV
ncbi:MAG: hypothetical protein H0T79_10840, partial [Deltaproteobacteria bacterium]|nr:hypothetical protein [Deltaproteobacteria bacterium]